MSIPEEELHNTWYRGCIDSLHLRPRRPQDDRRVRPRRNRLLRLTLLAPDIQEGILEGRQPKGLQLEELTRVVPAEWGEQRVRGGRATEP